MFGYLAIWLQGRYGNPKLTGIISVIASGSTVAYTAIVMLPLVALLLGIDAIARFEQINGVDTFCVYGLCFGGVWRYVAVGAMTAFQVSKVVGLVWYAGRTARQHRTRHVTSTK